MLFRIGLFLLTNLAVLIVLSLVMSIFGISTHSGGDINLIGTLIFSAIIGFTGSFISLALSKWIAIKTTGATVITNPTNSTEAWLVGTVHELARKANIGLPDVAIYPSNDPNAFATGMNKNKALVAVSTGLLNKLTQDEVKAVLAHEVAHIENGDMVTMTLIQGVVNTFVVFFARLVGHFIDKVLLGNREGQGFGYFVTVIAAEIVFGILASTIVFWFSRRREFRADAGAARLYNSQSMINALRRLSQPAQEEPSKATAVLAISGKASKFGRLFMSHPPINERIAALESNRLV